MDVVKQSDVVKLFDVLLGNGLDNDLATFETQVQEVFEIFDDTLEKENECLKIGRM